MAAEPPAHPPQPAAPAPSRGATPPVTQPPSIDVAGLVHRIPPGDALIGGSLLVLLILSLVGAWIRVFGVCSPGAGCTTGSLSFGSLWDGFGVLPALLLVAAIVWFVARAVPALRAAAVLPVPDPVVWMGFAALEIVLFLLHWVIDNQASDFTQPNATMPGWAAFCAIVVAGVLGAGAHLNRRAVPPRARPSAGREAAPSGATGVAAGALSADRSQWFDGTAWRPTTESVPPAAPRSEDGYYWWDGGAWRPVPR